MEVLQYYFNEKNILLAWERYKRSKRMVKDVSGLKLFELKLDENIKKLSAKLTSEEFTPSISHKFYMPKSSKTQRTQTILSIEDALVYQAVGNIIGMKVYDEISQNYSKFVFAALLDEEVKYGIDIFSKVEEPGFFFYQWWGRLYQRFADLVKKAIVEDEVKFKFETDITGFFDSIPHYNLLYKLEKKFNIEVEILDILSICLNKWSGTRDGHTPGVGIPQGQATSYLLANLILHDMDNMFIDEGVKYFRYMDDIHIFSYNENDLQKCLVKIDKYLKSNALSLNSKKTSIHPIENIDDEDAIIKFESISMTSDDMTIAIANNLSESEMIRKTDSEQENPSTSFLDEDDTVFATEDEIVSYFEGIKMVCEFEFKNEIGLLFKKNSKGKIEFKEEFNKLKPNGKKAIEREYLQAAYKYRNAINELKTFTECKPDEKLLDYWLFLLENYFWRADQYSWVLNLYNGNKKLKTSLFALINKFNYYEWVQYNLITCLTVTQKFSKKELQDIYRDYLQKSDSIYTREALYKLLIYHCDKDDQFFETITSKINREKSEFLKKEMLYYTLLKKSNLLTFDEIIEAYRI